MCLSLYKNQESGLFHMKQSAFLVYEIAIALTIDLLCQI